MQPHRQAAVRASPRAARTCRVPDLDRARAVLPLRDLTLEGRVLERVILDMDGEVLLARLERDAFRHRPGRQRAVSLEAEVVVQPARIVALHDEDRLLPALLAPEGLRVFFGSRFRLYSASLATGPSLPASVCLSLWRKGIAALRLGCGKREGLHKPRERTGHPMFQDRRAGKITARTGRYVLKNSQLDQGVSARGRL